MNKRISVAVGTVVCASLVLVGCGDSTSTSANGNKGEVTITNCGEEVTYAAGAKKLLVNDGNIISFPLALGAANQISAVSSVQRDLPILSAVYGQDIKGKEEVAKEYPSLEQIIAAEPDIYVAGWGYGFGEDKGITPEKLKEHGIDSYVLTESCRQQEEDKRGIVDPWQAIRDDLTNIGAITGHDSEAEAAVGKLNERLKALDAAPKADQVPTGFVFDSAGDAPFTSGSLGAPQGILEKAGARNATESIKDTWTTTNWELVAKEQPDFIALVEYPGQSFEEKIQILRTNPATKDLKAVKEDRFINLPYAMWCESPLNADAAEHVRKALEKFGLVPESDVSTHVDLPKDLPGLAYQS